MTSHQPISDLDRMRGEYAQRSQYARDNKYTFFNQSYLFTIQQRQRAILRSLRQAGITSLENINILEIGCGKGRVLLEFLQYGATVTNLHGIDLLPERLHQAQDLIGQVPVICADGQRLPFAANSHDLVIQFTAFSSILDAEIKRKMAAEMVRVLKPSGSILWYDFWINPTNPQTKGIGKAEIKAYFPNCRYAFQKLTLAPPLARKLVPFSWSLAATLERLQMLNTHYLAMITPLA
ncbi:MAG: class I SAM-dependent methyltransferase [Anaerolineales bacterium]|nr:class I SAM-dependent methyltransferase [Anaerolineales bacterium]